MVVLSLPCLFFSLRERIEHRAPSPPNISIHEGATGQLPFRLASPMAGRTVISLLCFRCRFRHVGIFCVYHIKFSLVSQYWDNDGLQLCGLILVTRLPSTWRVSSYFRGRKERNKGVRGTQKGDQEGMEGRESSAVKRSRPPVGGSCNWHFGG